jgi:hypothetical protein
VDKVAQNDKVTFDIKEGKKGPNAINVKKAWVSLRINLDQRIPQIDLGDFFCLAIPILPTCWGINAVF